MMEIADSNGNLIPHLKRDSSGAIIVHDPISKAKYEQQRSLAERVNQLELNINDIKSMLDLILKQTAEKK